MPPQVDAKRVHFPEEGLGSTKEVERLQTLLVRCQTTVYAFVTIKVCVLVTHHAGLRGLNFLKFMRVGSFGHKSFGLGLLQFRFRFLK